jgi:hypothetical protein
VHLQNIFPSPISLVLAISMILSITASTWWILKNRIITIQEEPEKTHTEWIATTF